ncbi:hypothetical protein HPB51_000143 [Rhipicephalus microplus]|uniref:Uncharacterized protein n=1 Tax=Rhipicephalus microplus TaxID=6941 RepID=A0A9J6D7N8_RHIMP|nr:hypothetical protein HPB51_000143 [Rhipicephalus microplus]
MPSPLPSASFAQSAPAISYEAVIARPLCIETPYRHHLVPSRLQFRSPRHASCVHQMRGPPMAIALSVSRVASLAIMCASAAVVAHLLTPPPELLPTRRNIPPHLHLNRGGFMHEVRLDDIRMTSVPTKHRVREVSCGHGHQLALTANGELLSWGNGGHGELGHGSLESVQSPRLIEPLAGVVLAGAAAGGWHSAALSDAGDLYLWGWNLDGQLATEPMEKPLSALPLLFDMDVCAVSLGSRHTAAVAALAVVEVQIGMQHALVVTERRVELQWSSTMVEENSLCCTNTPNCTSVPNEIDEKLTSRSYGC